MATARRVQGGGWRRRETGLGRNAHFFTGVEGYPWTIIPQGAGRPSLRGPASEDRPTSIPSDGKSVRASSLAVLSAPGAVRWQAPEALRLPDPSWALSGKMVWLRQTVSPADRSG